ncbi:hypothetical protein ACRJ4B_18890 [Streptomyces sp. GTA36]
MTGPVPALRYVTSLVTGRSSVWGNSCVPKPSEAGLLVSCWVIAPATSTRPVPCVYAEVAAVGFAEAVSAALIRGPVQSGCRWARIAAAPATCGVAIDVPLMET